MYKMIAVTNRKICNGDFLERIEETAAYGVDSIILREKDLSVSEYEKLASKVMEICDCHHVSCILHNFPQVAEKLGSKQIHMPLVLLKEQPELIKKFERVGTSVHSVEEAVYAQKLGVSYLIAGHIFATDCKKGLPPRGLDFLRKVCLSVKIPVYAIGGIKEDNIMQVVEAGAEGGCIMSGFMCK